MELLVLLDRVLLAAVFLLAGVTKVVDVDGSRKAVSDFGIPTRYATVLGTILPVTELGIGFMLIIPATARWGALAALGLLLVFTGAISLNLLLGRRPDCHCFGQLESRPISPVTLIRNVVLCAGAAYIALGGVASASYSQLSDMLGGTSDTIILAIVLIMGIGLSWGQYHLLLQNGRLLVRLDALEAGFSHKQQHQPVLGLSVGSPAPQFDLPLVTGGTLSLGAMCRKARPILLVFSDPMCGPCTTLLRELAGWQRGLKDHLTLAVISRGTPDQNHEKSRGLRNVLLQHDREVADAYGASGTPTGVMISPDGTIASSLALGAQLITDLVVRATNDGTAPNKNQKNQALPLPAMLAGIARSSQRAFVSETDPVKTPTDAVRSQDSPNGGSYHSA